MKPTDYLDGRHLHIDGVLNARDLGGVALPDGSRTRHKMLIRSALLHRVTAEGQRTLLDYGLKTIIDLRDASEVTEAPDSQALIEAVTYRHLPFRDDGGVKSNALETQVTGERYARMLDLYPESIRAILAAIAGADGCTLIHCWSGKDRTGIIAALILALAGVEDEDIIGDYAASADLLADHYAAMWVAAQARGEDGQEFDHALISPPEAMRTFLDGLHTRYGGAEAYMRSIGLSEGEIEALRRRLAG